MYKPPGPEPAKTGAHRNDSGASLTPGHQRQLEGDGVERKGQRVSLSRKGKIFTCFMNFKKSTEDPVVQCNPKRGV